MVYNKKWYKHQSEEAANIQKNYPCMTHKIDLRIIIWKTKELAADGERVWIPFSGLTLWILRTKTDAKKRSVPLSSSTEDSSSVIFLQCYKKQVA